MSSIFNCPLVALSRTCRYLPPSCIYRFHYKLEAESSWLVKRYALNLILQENNYSQKYSSSCQVLSNVRDIRNISNRANSTMAYLPQKTKCCSIQRQHVGWNIGYTRTVSNYVAGVRHLEGLKENDDFCAEAMKSGQFAVFYNLHPLVCMDGDSGRMKLVWKDSCDLEEILGRYEGLSLSNAVLLNSTSCDSTAPARFALHILEADSGSLRVLEAALGGHSVGMRKAMLGITSADVPDLLQAYALLQWHSMQVFCSKCGEKNKKNMAGSKRICSSCSEVHYPTMKPVVITLVTNGDKCLVARQPQFPPGMYSALAGFCDMGETLEDAVRREVAEEVGLELESIYYSSSQHWPLPASGLMLGCYATIKAGTDSELLIDRNELEDARWLTREEVQGILKSKGQSSLWLPPRQAIAHHLLRGWAFSQ